MLCVRTAPSQAADFWFLDPSTGGDRDNCRLPLGGRPAGDSELHSGRDGGAVLRCAAVGAGVRRQPRHGCGHGNGQCSISPPCRRLRTAVACRCRGTMRLSQTGVALQPTEIMEARRTAVQQATQRHGGGSSGLQQREARRTPPRLRLVTFRQWRPGGCCCSSRCASVTMFIGCQGLRGSVHSAQPAADYDVLWLAAEHESAASQQHPQQLAGVPPLRRTHVTWFSSSAFGTRHIIRCELLAFDWTIDHVDFAIVLLLWCGSHILPLLPVVSL